MLDQIYLAIHSIASLKLYIICKILRKHIIWWCMMHYSTYTCIIIYMLALMWFAALGDATTNLKLSAADYIMHKLVPPSINSYHQIFQSFGQIYQLFRHHNLFITKYFNQSDSVMHKLVSAINKLTLSKVKGTQIICCTTNCKWYFLIFQTISQNYSATADSAVTVASIDIFTKVTWTANIKFFWHLLICSVGDNFILFPILEKFLHLHLCPTARCYYAIVHLYFRLSKI